MYLISLYFDEKTNKRIQSHINDVAEYSGNSYMTDRKIPPHITLTAFEPGWDEAEPDEIKMCKTKQYETELIRTLGEVFEGQGQGILKWVSVGAFSPGVLFLSPVLNEYLHELLVKVSDVLQEAQEETENVSKCMWKKATLQPCYQPFSWLPHTTIGKRLNQEEMQRAFAGIQKHFSPFDGRIIKIGLSKTTPKEEIKVWYL